MGTASEDSISLLQEQYWGLQNQYLPMQLPTPLSNSVKSQRSQPGRRTLNEDSTKHLKGICAGVSVLNCNLLVILCTVSILLAQTLAFLKEHNEQDSAFKSQTEVWQANENHRIMES